MLRWHFCCIAWLLIFLVGHARQETVENAGDWLEMPNGLFYHASCIHQYEDDFHVRQSESGHAEIVFKDAVLERMQLPPCPFAPRSRSPQANNTVLSADSPRAQYYSDWVVDASTVLKQGFGKMASTWTVPSKPASRGPAPPLISSSIYIFNGLENGGGQRGAADVILQPVLQYGKSGCLLNPLKFGDWYFTAYQVGVGGRAFCGRNVGPLKEGEELVGTMTKLSDAGNNTWLVEATRTSTGEKSSHSADMGSRIMDAAYLTLEGMVIYNCKAFPPSGSVTFSNNTLERGDGTQLTGYSWRKAVRHSECSQDAELPATPSEPVSIVWDANADTLPFVV